jgi:hypothetical protein
MEVTYANDRAVSTRTNGAQIYDHEAIEEFVDALLAKLDTAHDAVSELIGPAAHNLPENVAAAVTGLRAAAERWASEIVSNVIALEVSLGRAELLAAGVDPDDNAAVDAFCANGN